MAYHLNLRPIGRFGNTLFQYAFAKAYCEKYDAILHCDPGWIGYRIFNLTDPVPECVFTGVSDSDDKPYNKDADYSGYAQCQAAMLYTKEQVRGWFSFKDEIFQCLKLLNHEQILAHRRVGDYASCGYPVVSEQSYYGACIKFGIDSADLVFVIEEKPSVLECLPNDLSWLADFYRLMNADVLLRGNSSFSWWAAMLNKEGTILSPVIERSIGGFENNVEFVDGNYPRLANLEFVTDLYVQ